MSTVNARKNGTGARTDLRAYVMDAELAADVAATAATRACEWAQASGVGGDDAAEACAAARRARVAAEQARLSDTITTALEAAATAWAATESAVEADQRVIQWVAECLLCA